MRRTESDSRPDETGPATFRIGDWIAEPGRNLLRSKDAEVAVEPRLMSLLTYLARRAGEPTAKEDILAAVWEGVSATDESLAQAVSKLRKLLGDDPERPAYIETIRKKGYRLLAEVEPVQAGNRLGRRGVASLVAVVVVAVTVAAVMMIREEPAYKSSISDVYRSQPLTSRPGRERDPVLSPDGQYVVYAAQGANSSSQIFVHGIDRGTRDRQLTARGESSAPAFFPDGDRIAFMRKEGNNCAVLLMTLVDGAERLIGDCTGNGYSDTTLSPDGTLLAFNAREDESAPHAIYLLDVSSGSRRRLTSPPAEVWGDFDPIFTADGESVIFARSISEGMQDIYRIELSAGLETRLTHEGRNVFGLTVHDDRIVYAGNRNGRYAILAMPLAGGEIRQLPLPGSGLVNPSIAADGSRLVYEVVERTVSLRSLDLETRAGNELLAFNADILHPDLSPEPGRLAFSSNRSGFYEIWSCSDSGEDLRQLTRFESGFTAHPKYSPEGDLIAFDARPDGVSRIYVMKSDGSALRPLTGAAGNAYAPTWALDGRALYYAAETGTGLEIFRIDLQDGEPEQASSGGGIYALEGPAGHLFIVRPGMNGIWRLDNGGSTATLAVASLDTADWGNWAVRGGAILYYERQTGTLRRLEQDGASPESLATIDGNLPTSDPAIAFTADGRHAVVGVRQRLESDIELVNLAPPD